MLKKEVHILLLQKFERENQQVRQARTSPVGNNIKIFTTKAGGRLIQLS
jgi:hypothetical protein